MTRWTLTLQPHPFQRIDASTLRRSWLADKTQAQIEKSTLVADGMPVPFGDLFRILVNESETDEIIIEGDAERCDGLGALHDRGVFRVLGHVGDYAGASLRGGTLLIGGSAGHFVGAPLASRKSGMSRATIEITGDAGDYVGHRMRRGTIVIAGSAGTHLASSMVAGTIAVGSDIGHQPCIGMRRGTVFLPGASTASLFDSKLTFSAPFDYDASFLSLYQSPMMRRVLHPLIDNVVKRIRADRSVGGQGEILTISQQS
ncbi:formylmethanofuran dehydrogenase subunit C [Rhodopirellula sp. MGV]|uniref:formylmethanofuran dehydrogenase subunit C n=1 Tax=Rhodopirellula sp. MGV TaxID=2023130 RepID=UPI000B96DED7|nr:formylmethanofuran dehydrogenase subunit C [Rhodopirellula sp. MGV]OYP28391.1 formylmethanofuran dehydrogenase subunit C [Rhodopirellula sp. MGV]PNY38735.1 formylmethanofuran dehydrogenase subunit C [Rhodopirellula baltica]